MMGSAGIKPQKRQPKKERKTEPFKEVTYNGKISTEKAEAKPARPDSIHEAVWNDELRGHFLCLQGISDEHYMQALTEDSSEGFVVELREGGPEQHYSSSNVVTREELEQILLKYAAGDQSFEDDLDLYNIDVDEGTKPKTKSTIIALVLAFFFGPFGLFYVSWKRALVLLLVFIVGVFLAPKNGFVVLLLWLVAPILSIIALGVGNRQSR